MEWLYNPSWWQVIIGGIVGVIAVPGAFYSIIQVGKKNNVIESKIVDLAKLIESQQSINNTLILHHKALKDQNDIFKEYTENQSLLLKDIFTSSENTNAARQKLASIEERKRKTEIRPLFVTQGGGKSEHDFHLNIKNDGKLAHIHEIQIIDSGNCNFNELETPMAIKENDSFKISGSTLTGTGRFQPTYECDIIFTDEDGNRYFQKVKSNHGNYKIFEPKELKSENRKEDKSA